MVLIKVLTTHRSSAVDPHSFLPDPDPAVFLNADPVPDTALKKLYTFLLYFIKNFLELQKKENNCSKVKTAM